LTDEFNFVFDIHFKIVGREEGSGLFQYLQEFACREPVIKVIGKPRLQAAQGVIAQGATTIHEPFVNARHFGDVSMGGNEISAR